MGDTQKTKTLVEKMAEVAHEIVDSLNPARTPPADLERKTAALRNLQSAITDGLGKQDAADPSEAVMKLLALEVEERQLALAERKSQLKNENDD